MYTGLCQWITNMGIFNLIEGNLVILSTKFTSIFVLLLFIKICHKQVVKMCALSTFLEGSVCVSHEHLWPVTCIRDAASWLGALPARWFMDDFYCFFYSVMVVQSLLHYFCYVNCYLMHGVKTIHYKYSNGWKG